MPACLGNVAQRAVTLLGPMLGELRMIVPLDARVARHRELDRGIVTIVGRYDRVPIGVLMSLRSRSVTPLRLSPGETVWIVTGLVIVKT